MFEQMLAGLESSPTAATPARALRSVAVVGAGPLGQAVACAALAGGCEVSLLSPFRDEATRLGDSAQLTVTGASLTGTHRIGDADGKGASIRIASGFDAAVAAADAVVLAVPASTHTTYAGMLAPVLKQGQIVVLIPGGCFGALEVSRVLRRNRCRAEVTVVELGSAPYLVSAPKPGRLDVLARLQSVPAAALPNSASGPAVAALSAILPMLRPALGVLETSFSDMSGLLVAAPALLSASAQGTASVRDRLPERIVESMLDALDAERRRTAGAYGVRELPDLVGWLEAGFGNEARDRVHALDEVPALQSMRCPDADDIAVHDAVETCLVPLASAAAAVGIATPATASLVGLASVLSGLDHARHGRSLGALGLDGLSADDIRRSLHDRETTPWA